LRSFFHLPETINSLLRQVGFKDVQWHVPVISQEGLDVMGVDFWEGYIENCDLAYFSARK